MFSGTFIFLTFTGRDVRNSRDNTANDMAGLDLHIHSEYSSDGEISVAGIAERCAASGTTRFSLTDHNSVKGLPEAAEAASRACLRFVPGIEIDCCFEGTGLHLLGYGIDGRSQDFRVLEETVAAKVMEAFGEVVGRLQRLGFAVDAQAVLAAANGKLPTLELMAEVMLSDERYDTPLLAPYREGGARGDMPYINFYLDYGAQGRPAFVPVEFMDYRDAVALVRDNGGVPVVAHPGLNLRGKERVVERLLDRGAEGLETFNNYHDAQQAEYFAGLVRRRGALMTCGSDFHGKTKPLINIGCFKSDARYETYLEESVARLTGFL